MSDTPKTGSASPDTQSSPENTGVEPKDITAPSAPDGGEVAGQSGAPAPQTGLAGQACAAPEEGVPVAAGTGDADFASAREWVEGLREGRA